MLEDTNKDTSYKASHSSLQFEINPVYLSIIKSLELNIFVTSSPAGTALGWSTFSPITCSNSVVTHGSWLTPSQDFLPLGKVS